uniref:HTH myb-type domain-containing protein n=1 Tax=Chenopodium quinoa TaxID=63459 RepID=A0A803M1X8_CHEQI
MHLSTNNFPSTSNSDYIQWTPEENKNFEKCLTLHDLYNMDANSFFQQISKLLGQSRTPQEVKLHFDQLLYDLGRIEAGLADYFPPRWYEEENSCRVIPTHPDKKKKNSSKGGAQWSKDEHRLFVIGLELYGLGAWKSISRWVVLTRSATQVASHAQKFCNKKNCPKVTKRSSIHNITTVSVDEAHDLCRKGKLSPQILDAYLQKLGYGPDQQEAHTSEPLETLASGCVQQEAYVQEPLNTLASGCVQQEAYVAEPLNTLASGCVQQEAYVAEPLNTLASGCVQQEAYVAEPLNTLASGCVQQEAYVPEPLNTLASDCYQQEMDESELEMLLKDPVLELASSLF